MKKVLMFLFISVNVLGQSVVIQPSSQGINASNLQESILDARGSGLTIQSQHTLSLLDPNLSVNTLSCGANPPYLTTLAGVIKYPNAGQYSANANCSQYIFLNGPNVIGIKITFEMLDTEANGDSVIIDKYYKFSGNNLPASIVLNNSILLFGTPAHEIRFKSDNDGNLGNGFRLTWKAVLSSSTPISPNQNFVGNGFIYDNSKLALRAGIMNDVGSTNIGFLSSSFGNYTQASGYASASFGSFNLAKGTASSAFGSGNTANGLYSSAFGSGTVANGDGSFTSGQSTIAKAAGSFSIGAYNDNLDNPSSAIPNPDDRIFQIGNGDSFLRKNVLTILRNGKAGVGVANPNLNSDERMEINGRLRIRDSTSTAGVWFNNSANSISHLDGAFHGMKTNTETGIFIGGNWRFWVNSAGNGYLNGNLIQTSDRRLKKDFSLIRNSLLNIYQLNGFHYKWIEETRSKDLQTGLIAQEVQKIFPELVQTNEKGFLSINYIGLVPHLIEAVKELRDENISLKTKNQTLETRLDKIETMLSTIPQNTENSNSKK
jgi:hypothetical protein